VRHTMLASRMTVKLPLPESKTPIMSRTPAAIRDGD
jgi:hypothetical protein